MVGGGYTYKNRAATKFCEISANFWLAMTFVAWGLQAAKGGLLAGGELTGVESNWWCPEQESNL
jgi:hypothetical protein